MAPPEGERNPLLPTKQLESFGRKVQATASSLLLGSDHHYQTALGEFSRELRRPAIQRSLFSFAQTSPIEIYRSQLSTQEIRHRALAHVPDEFLRNLPRTNKTYSLFEGFQASMADIDYKEHKKCRHRGRKLLTEHERTESGPAGLVEVKKERHLATHQLEMLGIRKNMCSSEIHDIDTKIANLTQMRQTVLERLADLEQEEILMEEELAGLDTRIDNIEQEMDDTALLTPPANLDASSIGPEGDELTKEAEDGFMSESMYEKLPNPKTRRRKKVHRRMSMPILHEHLKPGSNLKEIQAHNDIITALDFDSPFGTMVTASLDDTVRVWDLNTGNGMGMLEGHTSFVRCLQVDDEGIVATGSADATIRLWDLSKAQYTHTRDNRVNKIHSDEEDDLDSQKEDNQPCPNSMETCLLFSLEAHVDEITALHFRGDTLVSGSADKTMRQWDLEKGRCVQTLDVIWAAAQADSTAITTFGSSSSQERQASPSKGRSKGKGKAIDGGSSSTQYKGSSWGYRGGRSTDTAAAFIGALQVFDAALACGTKDGMVRLWDLRSGQVHRSLIGHTGPITSLQFDDVHLVTSSLDRSIRIWDLRTGSIVDAYAYTSPITSMMFDARHVVAAARESVVKVYDKTDGNQWDCGPGISNEVEEEQRGASNLSMIEKVRLKDGYMIEGRKNGIVGAWSC